MWRKPVRNEELQDRNTSQMKPALKLLLILVYSLNSVVYALSHSQFDKNDTKESLQQSEAVNNEHKTPQVSPNLKDTEPFTSPENVVHPSPKLVFTSKIDSFFSRLQSFVNDTGLDRPRLLEQSNSLSVDILGLGEFLRNSSFPKGSLGQLKFVNHLFEVMYDSAVDLLPYENRNDLNVFALRKIYDLELRILPLYTAQGKLNVQVRGYMSKLLDLHRNLMDLSKELRKLKSMPGEIKLLFQQKQRKLRKELSNLGRQVPVPKKLPGSRVGDLGGH